MKTPIQELIDKVKQLKYSEINEQSWDAYDDVMNIAESMLEKEKEMIENVYVVGYSDGDNDFYFNDDYYNETFNTKEK